MIKRGRLKPSKSSSLLGMSVGVIFVIIGVTTVIPFAGAFGLVWTLGALGITIFHGVNFFSKKGVSQWEVDVVTEQSQTGGDFEEKLRKLERLRNERIITEEEYQEKRKAILDSDW